MLLCAATTGDGREKISGHRRTLLPVYKGELMADKSLMLYKN